MQAQPYLMFDGRCEEAVEFYRNALGAKVEALIRFKDSPDPQMCVAAPGAKVMHTCFRPGDTAVMASDGQSDAARQDLLRFELRRGRRPLRRVVDDRRQSNRR